jgi:hypothetical protein
VWLSARRNFNAAGWGGGLRTLFLHVGPTKTGTSAIQDILCRHDGSVVIYPKVGLWADGSHHNLVLNFYRDFARPEVVREDVAGLFSRIAAEAAASQKDVVISSEVLGGRQRPGKFVHALRQALGSDFQPEILVGVREHFERAASIYNQRVKDGVTREQRGPDEFLVERMHGLVYAPMLRKLDHEKLRTSLIGYHPTADFVVRFLRRIGFPEERIPAPAQHNVSLSTKGLVATLTANRIAPCAEDRSRIFEALRRLPGFHGPSRFIFTKDPAHAAEPVFQEDRNFLQQDFGLEIEPPQITRSENTFRISEQEFDEISEATAHLEYLGAEFRTRLRMWVSSPHDG